MSEKQVLARRAAVCPGWRWMPGMRIVNGSRVIGDDPIEPDDVPDLDDPATLGCLLALVREAWGDPAFSVYSAAGGWTGHGIPHKASWPVPASPTHVTAATEAEALVRALEAVGAASKDGR